MDIKFAYAHSAVLLSLKKKVLSCVTYMNVTGRYYMLSLMGGVSLKWSQNQRIDLWSPGWRETAETALLVNSVKSQKYKMSPF